MALETERRAEIRKLQAQVAQLRVALEQAHSYWAGYRKVEETVTGDDTGSDEHIAFINTERVLAETEPKEE